MIGGRRIGTAFAATAVLLLGSTMTPALAADATAKADQVKVIVTFDGPVGKASERAIERAGGKVHKRLDIVNGIAADLPRGQLKQLAREAGVRSVERDARLTAFDHVGNTGDLEYENAWGVEHIGTAAVHAAGFKGAGVKVAIIDTGIDYIHDDPDNTPYVVDPEFLGNYKGGYDFANNDADPYDDNGHGTHVAGILAAEKNGYLVVGVAPKVDLYAVKILDAMGQGDVSNLILGLQWAVNNDMDVVNMSLGTHEVSPALATAVTNASAAGLLMVAASGNVNPLVWQELFYGCPVAFPGAYPEVLSTTFTNGNNALTGYSCTGPEVDFASPGDQIYSTVPIGSCMFCDPHGYSSQSGTSMASPHLAGTVALLLSAGITDTGPAGLLDDVRTQLCATADLGFGVNSTPIPASDPRYPKYFGCGVIDADGAVLGLNPPVNHPPVAADDTATTAEGTPVSVAIMANDSDPDNDPIHVASVGPAGHGTAILNAAGTAIDYSPAANYAGPDSFTYVLADGAGATDSATVSVTVTPVNHPPVAADDTATTAEETPVSVAIMANDSDPDNNPIHVASVGSAGHGTAILNAAGTAIDYSPVANYAGPDLFTYVLDDGAGGTDSATVSVTVTPVNDPPVATDDTLTVAEDAAPTNVAVLANDTDSDGGPLSTSAVTDPAHGSATINPDGSVAYAPDPAYSGADSFDYTVSDGAGGSDIGTVAVTVTVVDDPPTAAPASASTISPNPVTIGLSGSDPDTCQLTFQIIDLPDHGGVGSLTNLACTAGTPNTDAATIVYTPTSGYSGPDSFSYRVLDATGASAAATVSITVSANPPPNPIHVGDLDRSATNSGKNWTAKVTIRIDNGAHGAVSGAVITGTWSAGGSASCTTGAAGTCSVQKTKLPRASVASVTFTVISVIKSGSTYTPASNHDPDGDSTGTSIVILRPV